MCEITQQPSRFSLAVEQQRGRFVQQGAGKSRIFFDSCRDGFAVTDPAAHRFQRVFSAGAWLVSMATMLVCQPEPDAFQRANTSGGMRKGLTTFAGYLPEPRVRLMTSAMAACASVRVTTLSPMR